jgi:hypothetical protein
MHLPAVVLYSRAQVHSGQRTTCASAIAEGNVRVTNPQAGTTGHSLDLVFVFFPISAS